MLARPRDVLVFQKRFIRLETCLRDFVEAGVIIPALHNGKSRFALHVGL